ncbi:hypothetical protein O9929_18435 [Vibrio lentus]|nr:hypothetical protein [Vibrio lentus]
MVTHLWFRVNGSNSKPCNEPIVAPVIRNDVINNVKSIRHRRLRSTYPTRNVGRTVWIKRCLIQKGCDVSKADIRKWWSVPEVISCCFQINTYILCYFSRI